MMDIKEVTYGWLYRCFKRSYGRDSFWYVFFSRAKYCRKELRKMSDSGLVRRLSADEKAALRKVWGNRLPDERWFSFYNSIVREDDARFDSRYIPLDIQYCFLDSMLADAQQSLALDDKNMYDLYFRDVRMPKTIVHIESGECLDGEYNGISLGEAVDRCKKQGAVVAKPSVNTGGGLGIEFWNEADGEAKLVEILQRRGNAVVQELIVQHPQLSMLHPNSVNSIRMMTLHDQGRTEVLSTVVRMGVGGARLDNATVGGLFCGVKADGTLRKYAYNKSGEAFERTPDGVEYGRCAIPNFEECKVLVTRLSNRFSRVSRLISWDLSVGEDGQPILIEVNLSNGGADILQIANGPLYGDKTEAVLSQLFSWRKYRKYRKLF